MLETEIGDNDEEEFFSEFRFKSFRKHKLVQEDYTLLTINEPEEVDEIKTKVVFPDERLVKKQIELVSIDHKKLVEQEKLQREKEAERRRKERQMIVDEVKFIKQKEKETSKHLTKREVELEKLLEQKQARSK